MQRSIRIFTLFLAQRASLVLSLINEPRLIYGHPLYFYPIFYLVAETKSKNDLYSKRKLLLFLHSVFHLLKIV